MKEKDPSWDSIAYTLLPLVKVILDTSVGGQIRVDLIYTTPAPLINDHTRVVLARGSPLVNTNTLEKNVNEP